MKNAREEMEALVPRPYTRDQRRLIDEAAMLRLYCDTIDDAFLRGAELSTQERWLRLNYGHTLMGILERLGVHRTTALRLAKQAGRSRRGKTPPSYDRSLERYIAQHTAQDAPDAHAPDSEAA